MLNLRASLCAGLAAAVVSTLAQVAAWIAFTDAFPAILWRDARFAAAIVLGKTALDDTHSFATVWVAATVVHFALSIAYAMLLGVALRKSTRLAAVLAGTFFGALIFVVNMHLLTRYFPWFIEARDPITLAAHVVFGVTAALVYRHLDSRSRSC